MPISHLQLFFQPRDRLPNKVASFKEDLSSSDDEDRSLSSTFTVDETDPRILKNLFSPQEDPSRKELSPPHKQVTFDESRNQYYEDDDDDDDAVVSPSDLWYDILDYQAFRSERITAAKRVRKSFQSGEQYRSVMERVFFQCCQATACDEERQQERHQRRNDDDDDCVSRMLPPFLRAQLRSCTRMMMAHNQGYRDHGDDDEAYLFLGRPDQQQQPPVVVLETVGLERLIVSAIGRDRQSRHQQLMDSIWDIQDDCYLTPQQRSLHISHACCEISRPSRLMAAHVAQEAAFVQQQHFQQQQNYQLQQKSAMMIMMKRQGYC